MEKRIIIIKKAAVAVAKKSFKDLMLLIQCQIQRFDHPQIKALVVSFWKLFNRISFPDGLIKTPVRQTIGSCVNPGNLVDP